MCEALGKSFELEDIITVMSILTCTCKFIEEV